MLSFLIRHEFIETEKDDSIYFLTTETYGLIEIGDLELSLWACFEDDNQLLLINMQTGYLAHLEDGVCLFILKFGFMARFFKIYSKQL